jgi:uncharacterized protein (UPF0212 family)
MGNRRRSGFGLYFLHRVVMNELERLMDEVREGLGFKLCPKCGKEHPAKVIMCEKCDYYVDLDLTGKYKPKINE